MGYKNSDPCIQKALDHERLFVLMTRDETAPLAVLDWIKYNLHKQPVEKLREAFECALEMAQTHKAIRVELRDAPKFPVKDSDLPTNNLSVERTEEIERKVMKEFKTNK